MISDMLIFNITIILSLNQIKLQICKSILIILSFYSKISSQIPAAKGIFFQLLL